MWIYKKSGDQFMVGYYAPDGGFVEAISFSSRSEAEDHVAKLNGGVDSRTLSEIASWLEQMATKP